MNIYIKQIMFSYSYVRFNTDVHSLGVVWFMPFLALIKIIFYVLKKISKDNDINLFVNIILLSYLGYILGQKGHWLIFSFDVAIASIIFYYIGYILKKFDLLERIIKNNTFILILLTIWILGIKYGCIELAIRKYPNGLFCFLRAISGSICIIKFSSFIERKMKVIANILKWYGRNSMYILIFHCAEFEIINYNFLMISNKTIYKIILSSIKICISTILTCIYKLLKKIYSKIKRYNKFCTNN